MQQIRNFGEKARLELIGFLSFLWIHFERVKARLSCLTLSRCIPPSPPRFSLVWSLVRLPHHFTLLPSMQIDRLGL